MEQEEKRRNHLGWTVIYLVMTMAAKTTDPELEMSSGGGAGREKYYFYQQRPVITLTRSMSRTHHLSTFQYKMLSSLLF